MRNAYAPFCITFECEVMSLAQSVSKFVVDFMCLLLEDSMRWSCYPPLLTFKSLGVLFGPD